MDEQDELQALNIIVEENRRRLLDEYISKLACDGNQSSNLHAKESRIETYLHGFMMEIISNPKKYNKVG